MITGRILNQTGIFGILCGAIALGGSQFVDASERTTLYPEVNAPSFMVDLPGEGTLKVIVRDLVGVVETPNHTLEGTHRDAAPDASPDAAPDAAQILRVQDRLEGRWRYEIPGQNVARIWSCPPNEGRCTLSLETHDAQSEATQSHGTQSHSLGEGSLFFATLNGHTLLCHHIHTLNAPLNDLSLEESVATLNADACHVVTQQDVDRLSLRTGSEVEYVFDRMF